MFVIFQSISTHNHTIFPWVHGAVCVYLFSSPRIIIASVSNPFPSRVHFQIFSTHDHAVLSYFQGVVNVHLLPSPRIILSCVSNPFSFRNPFCFCFCCHSVIFFHLFSVISPHDHTIFPWVRGAVTVYLIFQDYHHRSYCRGNFHILSRCTLFLQPSSMCCQGWREFQTFFSCHYFCSSLLIT